MLKRGCGACTWLAMWAASTERTSEAAQAFGTIVYKQCGYKSLCVCEHVSVHVCFVHVRTHVCCAHVCTRPCLCAYICACVRVCMRICLCVCECVCMCV